MKYSEEQAEAEIKKHIEKMIADAQCESEQEAVMVLRKFLAVTAESIYAVAGKQDVVENLAILFTHYEERTDSYKKAALQ